MLKEITSQKVVEELEYAILFTVKGVCMTSKEKEIIVAALQLSRHARAALVEQLIESLERADGQLSDDWMEEIEKRAYSAQENNAEYIPAEELFNNLKSLF